MPQVNIEYYHSQAQVEEILRRNGFDLSQPIEIQDLTLGDSSIRVYSQNGGMIADAEPEPEVLLDENGLTPAEVEAISAEIPKIYDIKENPLPDGTKVGIITVKANSVDNKIGDADIAVIDDGYVIENGVPVKKEGAKTLEHANGSQPNPASHTPETESPEVLPLGNKSNPLDVATEVPLYAALHSTEDTPVDDVKAESESVEALEPVKPQSLFG